MLKGAVFTEEHRANIAAARRGTKASEETRAKMRASQALRGPRSEEHKAKISAALLGKPKSEAARKAMSVAKKGKPGRQPSEVEVAALVARTKARVVTPESREKMRQAKLGKPGPWSGKTRGFRSEEWRAAIGASNKGKVTSDETKSKIKAALIGTVRPRAVVEKIRIQMFGKTVGPRNGRWGKSPAHGRRMVYEGHVMRSSYEVAFAKMLDCKGVGWQYEPKRFDLGTCTYTPDFYIDEWDSFVEVKGWLGPDSQAKIRLFRETFPEIGLIVATKPILTMFGVRFLVLNTFCEVTQYERDCVVALQCGKEIHREWNSRSWYYGI